MGSYADESLIPLAIFNYLYNPFGWYYYFNSFLMYGVNKMSNCRLSSVSFLGSGTLATRSMQSRSSSFSVEDVCSKSKPNL